MNSSGRATVAACLVVGVGLWVAGPCARAAGAATPKVLSLAEALDLAKASSPSLGAARSYEAASVAGVGIAKASLLPTASLQAVDSFGFPGSTGYLGIGGLAGSPYRSGLAGDFVVQQEVYDFGKAEALGDVAKKDAEARRLETQLAAAQVQIAVLHVYTECSRLRSESELYAQLRQDADTIAKEVRKFVRTGQRSVVDRYLSQAQVEEAETSQAAAVASLGEVQKRLALGVGAASGSVTCPALAGSPQWDAARGSIDQNPYVAASSAQLEAERARGEAIRATYRPSINVLGSVGLMERSRLVPKTPYAVGVGFSMPLFNGFKDDYELERSAALVTGRQYEVGARKLEIEDANSRFDAEIAASQARLEHLSVERKTAQDAFRTAKKRYFAAEGDLADLREAIRNRSRTDAAFMSALARSVDATGAKALLNGGKVSPR